MKNQLSAPSHAATLRMVADASGVSTTTASRVINNAPHVRPEKREAVLAAIARLGFVPNTIARALADGRSRTIGIVVQHFESPCYAWTLRGVEEALSKAGYGLVVASGHWDRREEERCVQSLKARRVDGIIVLTGTLDDGYLTELAQDLPVVATGRDLKAPGLHCLHSNDFEGARAATRHLIQRGHRRIAHITGDPSHPDAVEREQGYRAALEEAGIAPDRALVVRGNYQEASGERGAEDLIRRGIEFTALFAANDQMAAGAAQALCRHGLRIPQDVSVVGFDDVLAAAHACPPRTTVNLSPAELGRRAVAAMLDLLAHRRPRAVAPEPELVVRLSTRFV